MSSIGPFPSGAVSTIAHREPTAQAAQTPAPDRAGAQTSRTELSQAVQQAQAGQRAEKPAWTPVKVLTDRQGRLVGPPPTFEVNVLETLRANTGDDPLTDVASARQGYGEIGKAAPATVADPDPPPPDRSSQP